MSTLQIVIVVVAAEGIVSFAVFDAAAFRLTAAEAADEDEEEEEGEAAGDDEKGDERNGVVQRRK